jgi:S-adenosylmethionine:tRNA ribosyltransferase-isomerase
MLESRGSLRRGETITLSGDSRLILHERDEDAEHLAIWTAELDSPLATLDLLARIGRPPLPPYIRKARRQRGGAEIEDSDGRRYNTVYAAAPGSVAAPTAGLHFTDELLRKLEQSGVVRAVVTLHVGPGTFAPIRCDDLDDHLMHEEWVSVPPATLAALAEARERGGRIIPVGTTSVRALESIAGDPVRTVMSDQPFVTRTRLLIQPGAANEPFPYRFTDGLMTNFHLPRSTQLALVAAQPAVGLERLKAWYDLAAASGYRFYSYGDAMWLA